MKCHVCGSAMEPVTTTLPFKITQTAVVIVKNVPALQCCRCQEYLLDDPVMEYVDGILRHADQAAELEVLTYTALSGPAQRVAGNAVAAGAL